MSDSNKQSSPISFFWVLPFVFAALVSVFSAYFFGQKTGMTAYILFLGMAIVFMLGASAIVFARASNAVEEEEPLYETDALLQALPTASLIVKNGMPQKSNAGYMQLAADLGVAVEEDIPPSIERLFTKEEEAVSAAIFRLFHSSDGKNENSEIVKIIDKFSQMRTFKISVYPLEDGQLWQFVDLDELEQFMGASTLEQAPIGLFSVNTNGEILQINDTLLGWIGLKKGEPITHMHEFIENPGALLDAPKKHGQILRADSRILTKKGVVSPVVMSGKWLETENNDIYASIALYGHSSIAKPSSAIATKANKAGQENIAPASYYTAPFGILRLDSADIKTAHVLEANPAAINMTGQPIDSQTMFKSLFEHDSTMKQLLQNSAPINDTPVELHIKNRTDGDYISVDTYFLQDGDDVLVYLVDISQRKELENQLLQSQKMQAIGQLAGGVAHDFNNLLTAIRLNTDELLGRHPIGDPSYPELQKINQTVSRATGLVRKLLAFSRKQTLRTQVLDVTETLSDLSVLLKQVLVENIKLEVIHGRELDPIQADINQLETVLMNLCVNARDAMLETGGGTITLSSSKVDDEELEEQKIPKRDEGGYVRFDVKDTGTGMDEETRAKIFEPFFTTKEQGKGTGLGLATVYGIVQQSGGHLRVKSEVGKGSVFSVYIPTASKHAKPVTSKKLKQPERVKPADLAGSGKLLFVEDEASVRVIAAKTLRKRGYEVIEAEDGEEALDILKSGEHEFDLMISDVIMPGIDGPSLLKQGRELLGDAKIIFISGYAEEEFSDLLAEESDVTFLPKPFTLVQLAEKVKQVLGD